MTAMAEALRKTHPQLVATSRLATIAINALRRTDDVERAVQRVSDLLIDEEPLMAELFGHDAVRAAVRRLIFNCARDMAGRETDGAAQCGSGASGAHARIGPTSSTQSEPAHIRSGDDAAQCRVGRALNPIGGERPSGRRSRFVEPPSSSGAHRDHGVASAAPKALGAPVRPNPSHRTLASVSGTSATAASGLLYTFRLRDGRVLGSVRWDELPEIAKAGERETKIVRRLLGHAAHVPSGARVADVVSEATLAQFVKEIDDAV